MINNTGTATRSSTAFALSLELVDKAAVAKYEGFGVSVGGSPVAVELLG